MTTKVDNVTFNYTNVSRDLQRFYGTSNVVNDISQTANFRVLQFANTRTTEDSKGWKARIRQGLNATGYLNGTRINVEYSPATLQQKYTQNHGFGLFEDRTLTFSGMLQFLNEKYAASSTLPVEAIDGAAEKYYRKARKAQRTIESLVVLGEAARTTHMIMNSGKQLQDGLFKFLRDLDFMKRSNRKWWNLKAAEIVSDLWLTYAYGVKPLLGDIDAGAKALAEDRSFLSEKVSIKASYKTKGGGQLASHSGQSAGISWTCKSRYEEEWDCTYYGKVMRNIPYTTNVSQSVLGYDWSNLAPAAWELIPYSFLVDYFSNVGEIISAYSFNQTTCAWQSRTLRSRTRVFITDFVPVRPLDTSSKKITSTIMTPGKYAVTTQTVVRGAIESVPVPNLHFEIPGLSTKWINMAALAWSRNRILAY